MKRTFRHPGALACLTLASIALLIVASVVPLPAQGAWKELKTLSDWTVPAGRGRAGAPAPDPNAAPGWHFENGVIVGGQARPGERTGALTTNDKYMDFEMELDFQIAELGTKCSEVLGPEQQNTSEPACLYNSGINWRSGYQLNIGRREAGEYIGLVIHRTDPKAIRGNILWLSHGDREFPNLRKKLDWNSMRIAVKGDHMQTWLNGTKIVDINDKSTIEEEATWRVPQPVTIQMPYIPDGFVKFRNIRIRTL